METKKELNTREAYEAPVTEVVEVMVEEGFQASGPTPAPNWDPLKEQIF